MKVGLLYVLMVLLSCQRTELRGPGRIEDAYIADNNLMADGCENNVQLTMNDSSGNPTIYKPTPATLPVYLQALAMIPPVPNTILRAVKVRFTETGRQVELLCGWGQKPKVNEIDLLEVRPR